VSHHASGHKEHEHQVRWKRVKHLRGGQVVHSEGGEECECPTATDTAAGKDAISRLALKPNAAGQQGKAHSISAEHLAGWSPGLEFVRQEECQPNDQDGDAELVQPVGSQLLFY
jgi:hypothetical protein